MRDRHFMVDCETWSTADSAVIRMVMLAEFDPSDGSVLRGHLIDARPSIDSQLESGRAVSGATVHWWRGQVRLSAMEPREVDVCECVLDLDALATAVLEFLPPPDVWQSGDRRPRIWSRGGIDVRWLASLLRDAGAEPPWSYWQERDVRTLDEFVPHVASALPHWPVADVHAQVAQVGRAFALAAGGAKANNAKMKDTANG